MTWRVDATGTCWHGTDDSELFYMIFDDDGKYVANARVADAQLIVRAVNSHRELLEALDKVARMAESLCEPSAVTACARAAIAKANA